MSGQSVAKTTRLPRFLAGPPEQLQLSWRAALAVMAFGTSLLLLNLGGSRVLTFHEAVFCEPAREMIATGDWLIPRIAGVPFLDKPPLTAWIAAGAMQLTVSRSEWVMRLPSVASANITALAIALLAARWYGSRIGMLAGMIQFTVYYTLQLARLAECDTHLIAAITLAMTSFAAANIESPRGRSTARWLPWLFSLSAGLSFLIKGPVGPLLIFSGCGLFMIMSQDLRAWRFFLTPLGLALFALCVLPYPLMAYAAHPPILDAWLLHNLGRFQGALEGQKPVYYYLVHLPMVLLPWFPLLPLYLWRRRGEGVLTEPLWQFILCWMIPGITVFSLSAFKKHHYLAPLLPGVSIFLAVALIDHLQRRHRGQRLHNGWLILATTAACGLAVLIVYLKQPRGATAICWLITAFAASLTLMALLESRRMFTAHLATILATAWLCIAGAFAYVMPHHDSYRDQAQLAQRINRAAPTKLPIYMVDLPESQIAYYLDCPLVRLDEPEEFLNRLPLDQPGEYHVLTSRAVAAELADEGDVQVLDECASLNAYMQPSDRLTFVRLTRSGEGLARRPGKTTSESQPR